ncbi:MAG TPA: hypothetical protein VF257_01605 [Solirubrobacteraceae bacterium]
MEQSILMLGEGDRDRPDRWRPLIGAADLYDDGLVVLAGIVVGQPKARRDDRLELHGALEHPWGPTVSDATSISPAVPNLSSSKR